MGNIAEILSKTRDDNENNRKDAINQMCQLNLGTVSEKELTDLKMSAHDLGDDANLTIRYFAKKFLKSAEDFAILNSPNQQKTSGIACPFCGEQNEKGSANCQKCESSLVSAKPVIDKPKPAPVAAKQTPQVSQSAEADDLDLDLDLEAEVPEEKPKIKTKSKPAPVKKALPKPKRPKPLAPAGSISGMEKFFHFIGILFSLSILGTGGYELLNANGMDFMKLIQENFMFQLLAGTLLGYPIVLFSAKKFITFRGSHKLILVSLFANIIYAYTLECAGKASFTVLKNKPDELLWLIPLLSLLSGIFVFMSKKRTNKLVLMTKWIILIAALYSFGCIFYAIFDFNTLKPETMKNYSIPMVDSHKKLDFLKDVPYYGKPGFIGFHIFLPLISLLLLLQLIWALITFKIVRVISLLFTLSLVFSPVYFGKSYSGNYLSKDHQNIYLWTAQGIDYCNQGIEWTLGQAGTGKKEYQKFYRENITPFVTKHIFSIEGNNVPVTEKISDKVSKEIKVPAKEVKEDAEKIEIKKDDDPFSEGLDDTLDEDF